MLVHIFSVIAPVFICAGIGYGWARSGRNYDTEMVTTLMVYFGTPCLVFATLVKADLTPAAFFATAGYAAISLAIFAAVGYGVLRAFRLPMTGFLPPLMFANTGNMGLPLCLLAFGDEGLALAVAYFTVSAVAQFTVGPALAAGTVSYKDAVRNPILYAVAIALVFMYTSLTPPAWAFNTVDLLGGLTIPMMLITLGVSLGRLRVVSIKRGVWLSVLRLAMGFAVGVGVAEAFALEGVLKGVVVLEGAMPVAVFNYLFAQRYDARPEEVAGMVIISTVMSMLTLPALIWYVL